MTGKGLTQASFHRKKKLGQVSLGDISKFSKPGVAKSFEGMALTLSPDMSPELQKSRPTAVYVLSSDSLLNIYSLPDFLPSKR